MFPLGCRGAVLITTRNPDFRQYGSAGSCRVDELSDEDAVTLLIKTAKAGDIDSIQDLGERASASLVVKMLGNLALAIVQAGAVIRQHICSLNGFCELYSQQRKRLLEIGRPKPTDDYQYSVYTTWEISILRIEEMSDVHAAFALELLQLFSFMHFDGIVEVIFKNARNNTRDFVQGCLYSMTSAYGLTQSGWDPLVLAQALKILVEFSLITIDDSRRIAMHPLVHEWSRERMSETQRAEVWERSAAILSMSIIESNSASDWQYRRSLLPHIDACLDCKEGRELLFANSPRLEERLGIAGKFANAYKESGRFESALNLERRILECRKSILPEEDPSTLATRIRIATLLNDLCQHREAAEVREYLMKVALKDTADGSISLSSLIATNDLAASYNEIGRHEDARKMMVEVLTGFKHIFGADDSRTLQAQVQLASCCYKLKRWKEAAPLQEQVLQAYEERWVTHILRHCSLWSI